MQNENEEIFGYFCFGVSAQVPEGNQYKVYSEENIIDLALVMNPDFTGQGKSSKFLE